MEVSGSSDPFRRVGPQSLRGGGLVHVAILRWPYLREILTGRKTVESRITRTLQPPHGMIARGDRLFLKIAGGRFVGTAVAERVDAYERLTPEKVAELQRRYRPTVGGDDEYWHGRRNCRFATFIHLETVEPLGVGPSFRVQHMKAWYVLPGSTSPVVDVTLTDGAVRNRYVRLPAGLDLFQPGPCTLLLPEGEPLRTQINDRLHIGGRRWAQWKLSVGTVVRFVALGPRRYAVTFREPARAPESVAVHR